MITAIIFDCFGVLTTDSWLSFKADQFGHDDALRQAATDLNKQADAGLISYDEFISGIARLADKSAAEVRAAVSQNAPNTELFYYIATLRPTYKIGLLSNVASNFLKELFTAEQLVLFDAFTLSSEIGFIKPQPRAYEMAAEQLGAPIGECVLIDDQPRYCDGATTAGMSAILYQDFEQMKTALHKLLAPPHLSS